jgi:autotransporter-associated beta strand protein
MRAHLLTTTAAVAVLAATSAHATDGTWQGPGAEWTTGTNWSSTPTVPDNTATFTNNGAPTSVTISASTSINTMAFTPGAPAYSFTINGATAFTIAGAGIVNASSNAPNFFVGPVSTLSFTNNSTAGNAVITNNAGGFSAVTTFFNSSTAGNATINNTNLGFTSFNDTSTAGNATIANDSRGFLAFLGSATAGNASITNSALGSATFSNSSTAGNATITTNLLGFTTFTNSSTAGNATVITNFGGTTQFSQFSTAGNATVITNGGGTTQFSQLSTGGNAAFTTQAGGVFDMSGLTLPAMTAGSIAGGGTYFLGSNALIVGGNNMSTAVSGTISDGGISGGTGGSLIKVGSGTLTLTGTNTYTGPTIVNAGALIVEGSIARSSMTTVNNGAVFLGGSTVGSTVVNAGGFLVPGPVGTPGMMTVVGDLTIQRNAFYVVQVNPRTASSINVSGTASLDGTVAAVFTPGIYLARSYTILRADNRRTGRFEDLETFGLSRNFRARLDYFNNTVDLNLRAQLIPGGVFPDQLPIAPLPPIPGLPLTPQDPPDLPPDPALPPFTSNQVGVGRAIDNFFNNGGTLPPAFVSLYGLSGANLTAALDQLSGEAATGAQQVGFQLGNQFLNLMLDPFVDGRSGVGGADHPALGFAPERETMPPDIAHAYAAVLKAPPKAAVPVYEPGWTAWGGAYGGGNRTSGDPAVIGTHDLSANTAGFAAGLDYRLTSNSVVGVALAGGGTNWNLAQGLGGGKSDAFQAGVYGATRFGPAYLAAAFAFTNHWMSTDRTAVGDRLTASFNAQSYGGRIESGYRFGTPYGGITPYAAIQAQSFHTPGYTETDAIANGFALTFNGRDATDTRSEVGTRFDRVLAVYSTAVLALRGRVAWAHDWVSDPSLLPVFQALPGASFIVNGATPAKNSALASAGAELRLANGVTLLAKFDGEFAAHSTTYAGTGTVRYTW